MNIYHHHTIRIVGSNSNIAEAARHLEASPSKAQATISKGLSFDNLLSLLHLATVLVGPVFGRRTANESSSGQGSTTGAAPAETTAGTRDERNAKSDPHPTNSLIAQLFLQAHDSATNKTAVDAEPLA